MLLDLEWQSVLEQARHVLTVVTVPVADREEMTVSQVQHVWVREIRVLIHFVGVVRRDASLGGERELGHDIVDVGAGSERLLRGSYWILAIGSSFACHRCLLFLGGRRVVLSVRHILQGWQGFLYD